MSEATSTAQGTTVALVHGAFADSSSWSGVIERLHAAGTPVRTIVNPLRGIAADSAYVASAVQQIPGPVLAVGHSYGGAVITNAATNADNVIGLVYVAAFAPDEGETLQDIEGTSRDSVLASSLRESQYPVGSTGQMATELFIDESKFRESFAADAPQTVAEDMAATQRPIAASGFGEKSGPPAWKKLPSWAVVATGDKAAGADVVLSMAQRANARVTEVDGAHAIMVSQPTAVTDVILDALRAMP